nr:hypothetical protein BaRGS_027699 [Batillaria attramentaria]
MTSLRVTLYLDVRVDEVDSEKLEAAISDLLLHNLTSMANAGDDVKLELSYKKGYDDNGCNPAACDPYFVVSIFSNERVPTINLTYTTGSTQDSADITFRDVATIGQAPNPIVSTYDHWPGAVVVTVDVYDNNSAQAGVPDVLLANLSMTVTQYPLPASNTTLYSLLFPPVNNNSSGEIVTCSVDQGLVCNNADNFPIPCSDYQVRLLAVIHAKSGQV